jgi:hypothetical protein
MPTVSETTYDSVRAICLAQKIQGTLVWSEMVLLFNHTCFAKYPHFQLAELKHNKVSNNSSRVTQNYTNHGGNKESKCVLHPDGNHTTAECNKLRNLKGTDKGKGKRTDKRNPRNQTKPYQRPAHPNGKGKGGGKGKGKPPSMGSRTPRTDITCDHCQKKGHVARDCYTRQNGHPKVLTQAVTTTNERSPLVVEFQQYVTDVKRKATSNLEHEEDTTNEQQDESATVSHEDTQHASSTEQEAPATDNTVQEWGTFEPAWGTGPIKDNTKDASWETAPTSTPRNNY